MIVNRMDKSDDSKVSEKTPVDVKYAFFLFWLYCILVILIYVTRDLHQHQFNMVNENFNVIMLKEFFFLQISLISSPL